MSNVRKIPVAEVLKFFEFALQPEQPGLFISMHLEYVYLRTCDMYAFFYFSTISQLGISKFQRTHLITFPNKQSLTTTRFDVSLRYAVSTIRYPSGPTAKQYDAPFMG